MLNKHKYVCSVNSKKVIIENAFGSLKTKWHILKHFNSRVDRATKVVVIYCILTTVGSKHGWGTQKDYFILNLLDPFTETCCWNLMTHSYSNFDFIHR